MATKIFIVSFERDSKTIYKSITEFQLTIRLLALNFYEVIVDEGEARINYHLIEIESE